MGRGCSCTHVASKYWCMMSLYNSETPLWSLSCSPSVNSAILSHSVKRMWFSSGGPPGMCNTCDVAADSWENRNIKTCTNVGALKVSSYKDYFWDWIPPRQQAIRVAVIKAVTYQAGFTSQVIPSKTISFSLAAANFALFYSSIVNASVLKDFNPFFCWQNRSLLWLRNIPDPLYLSLCSNNLDEIKRRNGEQ